MTYGCGYPTWLWPSQPLQQGPRLALSDYYARDAWPQYLA